MLVFAVYFILFLYVIYRWSRAKYRNFVMIVFSLKAIFIFLISYSVIGRYSFFDVPDDIDYFNDIVLFQQFAKQYPIHYLQFLVDIDPKDKTIYSQFFTQTDAWYKAPEFFYNDNRWVIKIHSLLSFISGNYLSVHRLFSAIFSIVGWVLIFNFVRYFVFNERYSDKKLGWIFLLSSLFPAFFFYTNFILKESIMILIMGLILNTLYKWIIQKDWNIVNVLSGVLLIAVSFFFRPAFLLPLILLTIIFLLVNQFIQKHKTIIFLVSVLFSFFLIHWMFQKVFNKDIGELVQYRQERFLDASKGGLFLLNTQKFVRVPYDWNNLTADSSDKVPVFYIKKNVPIMYWRLTNLNDTIIELNKDTGSYRILYYIEKANRTYYLRPINVKKNFTYNLISVIEAMKYFFFYPYAIHSFLDLIVVFENLLLLILLLLLIFQFKKKSLFLLYIFLFVFLLILIISITSPNTGAIFRYRYFILPLIFSIIAETYFTKKIHA